MNHPLYFCTGIVRSGSTWSFNVMRLLAGHLARRTGLECASTYFDGDVLDRFVQNELGNLTGPVLIKVHGLGPAAISLLESGRAKAVCTVRDPRDCVASDLKFLKKDITFSIRRVMDNLMLLKNYEGATHTLFVPYEQMMANPLKQVHRIAGHLGIDADESTLAQIDAACGLDATRAAIDELKKKSDDAVNWFANHRVDPTNQLHENHVHDAKIGKWRDDFTAAQADRMTTMFRPWLVRFGYEAGSAPTAATKMVPTPAMSAR